MSGKLSCSCVYYNECHERCVLGIYTCPIKDVHYKEGDEKLCDSYDEDCTEGEVNDKE